MLASTRVIDCVWCVQIVRLNLHLEMQHIVMMILHVMENLVFLMLNIQHVVSFIKYLENMNDLFIYLFVIGCFWPLVLS